MLRLKIKFKGFAVFILVLLMILLITYSDICKLGVERGLLISANVIIPSIFPFLVCILIIVNMNINFKNKLFSKVIYNCLGQNFEMFLVMLFSMLGGYPVGCRLINELCSQKKIDKKSANIMQMYCINAGPAFIITAVGSGILGNKAFGIILFVAHITSSTILALLCAKRIRKNFKNYNYPNKNVTKFSDIFVKSTADAAQSVMTICFYVILFSVVNSYLIFLLGDVPVLRYIFYFTEVTTAVTYTKNIYFISFLLGFSGISIWCQIFSLSKNAGIDLKLFILGRILHGGMSCSITYFLIKILKISNAVYSNAQLSEARMIYDDLSVTLSIVIMVVVLLIFIYSKNNSRKIIDDMV